MTHDIALCTDCVFADANGPDPEMHADWSGFLPEWDGWGFLAKFERYGHDILWPEPHFGKAPCDGCGSGLAGDRWDYAAWPTVKESA